MPAARIPAISDRRAGADKEEGGTVESTSHLHAQRRFINNNPCAECEKIIDVPIYQCPEDEPVVLPDGSFNPKCKKMKPKER